MMSVFYCSYTLCFNNSTFITRSQKRQGRKIEEIQDTCAHERERERELQPNFCKMIYRKERRKRREDEN